MMQDRPGENPQFSANCDRNVAPGSLPSLHRPVVLIGMMGSGKSQLGRQLARTMDLPFADSDNEFETAAGLSIADYFAKYGEDAFREGEYKVMDRLLDGSPKIIAAGGGIVTLEKTRAILKTRACAIWLTASPVTLAARCAGSTKRPLLNTGDPVATLTALLDKRGALYAEVAQFQVSTEKGCGDEALAHLKAGIETWLATA